MMFPCGESRWRPGCAFDLPQVVHLIQRVEVVLHALDGDVLAILDALRLQNLGKRPLALLRHEAVLCRDGAEERGGQNTTRQEIRGRKEKRRVSSQLRASRFRSPELRTRRVRGRPSRQARHGPLVASRAGGRRRRTNAIAVPTPRRARMARWTSTPRRSLRPAVGHPTTQKGTRSRMRKDARPRPDADRGPAPIGRVAGLVERVLERALVSRETRGMFSEPSTANARAR